MAQTPFELEQIVRLCESVRPARILEVGVWHGGTLWEWLGIAAEKVVAVDNQMLERETWEGWAADAAVDLVLIHGNSADPDVVAQVAAHGPFDFAFIDGDHAYDGVKSDWENYGPLASVVAFHDILPRPDHQVDRLWQELKPGRRTIEIVGTEPTAGMDNPTAGIGAIFQ